MARETEGVSSQGGKPRLRVNRRTVAGWAGMTQETARRLLARYSLPYQSPLDLAELVGALLKMLRRSGSLFESLGDDEREQARLERLIDIETKRERLENIRARTALIRREWVRISDVRDRAAQAGQALRHAGEQLGQRFGPDAVELFNAALDLGIASLLSVEPVEPEEGQDQPDKARGRKKGARAKRQYKKRVKRE